MGEGPTAGAALSRLMRLGTRHPRLHGDLSRSAWVDRAFERSPDDACTPSERASFAALQARVRFAVAADDPAPKAKRSKPVTPPPGGYENV